MCEDQNTYLPIVTENGFKNENTELGKIQNCNLANLYCRRYSKGWGVAIFMIQSFVSVTLVIQEIDDNYPHAVKIKLQIDRHRHLQVSQWNFFSKSAIVTDEPDQPSSGLDWPFQYQRFG